MASGRLRLRLHFLNVGHGSSIIIEAIADDGTSTFGLVDSNTVGSQRPKALERLQRLGAKRLSFVMMTHPHTDHYYGLFDVVNAFPVDTFFTSPLGDLQTNQARFEKLKKHLGKLARFTDSATNRRASVELIQILNWADTSGVTWEECAGDDSVIAPAGFTGISMTTVQPPRRAKSGYIARVEAGSPMMFGTLDDNEISLALKISFRDRVVLLGGDSTVGNWELRRRFEERHGSRIEASVVNLPHHGSALDSPPTVLEQIFAPAGGKRYGITSANGVSHPSFDLLEWQHDNEIDPFCTNLHVQCGANVVMLRHLAGLDHALARTLREWAVDPQTSQPCQGDITVTIEDDGALDVVPEFDHFCPFRTGSVAALTGSPTTPLRGP